MACEVVSSIKRAADTITGGGVVAFPTETSYGIGAAWNIPSALDRVFEIKHRPRSKPLLLLVAEKEWLDLLTARIPSYAKQLMDRFWPGPLTILLPAKPNLPAPITGATGKVAVRISSNPTAFELTKAAGRPITATSANLAGAEPCRSPQEILKQLTAPCPDLVLDDGILPPSPPSTIVDCTGPAPELVRKGALSL